MAPLILGFVLGDMMEQNLRRALSITNGERRSWSRARSRSACGSAPQRMVLLPPLLRLLNRRHTPAVATA